MEYSEEFNSSDVSEVSEINEISEFSEIGEINETSDVSEISENCSPPSVFKFNATSVMFSSVIFISCKKFTR